MFDFGLRFHEPEVQFQNSIFTRGGEVAYAVSALHCLQRRVYIALRLIVGGERECILQ